MRPYALRKNGCSSQIVKNGKRFVGIDTIPFDKLPHLLRSHSNGIFRQCRKIPQGEPEEKHLLESALVNRKRNGFLDTERQSENANESLSFKKVLVFLLPPFQRSVVPYIYTFPKVQSS